MGWGEILKVRSNISTPDLLHGDNAFLVKDDIYRQAGGQVLGDTTGDRFMDIEDIEEAIERKLTFNDFKTHHLNWKSNTNKTLLDRVGGFEGQKRLAETQIRDMMDSLHRGKPFDNQQMYELVFRLFLEAFGDVSPLTNELIFVLRNYMDINVTRGD